MTESEKARAYDEALKRAESAIKNCGDNKGRIAMIESIFPVLYQSEDERIRKRLIDFFEDWREYRSHCWGIAVTDILAWLEKQGKQKPTDKVEHECSCKYVGCHINDSRRWCHYLDNEIPYDRCNSYCPKYNIKPTAWSDEDEKMYKIAFSCIETLEDISNGKNMHADVKEWLKDRIGG